MKRFAFALGVMLLAASIAWIAVGSGRGVFAQSSTPPRIFQAEVRGWLTDPGVDTVDWEFTYMNDGSLHLVTTQSASDSCPTLNVPNGVFVSYITSALETGTQPGNDQPIEICEGFFTRANG